MRTGFLNEGTMTEVYHWREGVDKASQIGDLWVATKLSLAECKRIVEAAEKSYQKK
jgi:hypothetical protein